MAIEGQLLYRGYQFGDELVLDLYGEPADECDGYHVMTATPTGTLINLADLLSFKQLEEMGYWLDRRPAPSRTEGLIARIEQDRQMRQTDNQWRQF